MPIKPENRHRYPANWPEIRVQILARARWRCEWPGCQAQHHAVGLWERVGGVFAFVAACGSRLLSRAGRGELAFPEARRVAGLQICDDYIVIVLTIAHLDHTPENCAHENLRAWCQRHHLAYDAEHHRQTAYMARKRAARTPDLFEVPHG